MLNKAKKKKSKKWIIIVIILLVVVLGASRFLSPNSISVYDEYTAEIGTVETYYSFSGNIESSNTGTVMASEMMQIEEILVEEGDTVSEGDVLFKTTNETEVTATIDGTIDEIYIELDQVVMAGTSLCSMIDFENLQIDVRIDEYDIMSVEVGKEFEVYIGAIDTTVIGEVSKISNTAQSQNGVSYFTATVELEYDENMKIGLTAEATMLKETSEDVITISMDAISFEDDNTAYVLVKNSSEQLEVTYIETGLSDGTTVEILSGLDENDVVYATSSTASSISSGMTRPMM